MDEQTFLMQIQSSPHDDALRIAYADWLEDRGDARGQFVRVHLRLRKLSADHALRPSLEEDLSRLRVGIAADWLEKIEPERLKPSASYSCSCYEGEALRRAGEPRLHNDAQDTECAPWKRLLDLIEEAAQDGRSEFAPLRDMPLEDRSQILTLPPTIGRLKKVRVLHLYGSGLVRIPPEIGEMESLEEFVPYTSYLLHWYPYEITRCTKLHRSTVSTRSLYGNRDYRSTFPRLVAPSPENRDETTRPCSVCRQTYVDRQQHRVWISLAVATDVLPLLVNACSQECLSRLPTPPEHYVQEFHRGGHGVRQPDPG